MNSIKTRVTTALSALCLSSLCLSATMASAAQQPNILYIMADDHSAAAVGAYATTLKGYVQTPNIDSLAAQGAKFTNVHAVNALCAPSRASIISGLYSHKSGVFTLREDFDSENVETFPKVLQGDGYQTAVIGKWHIHGDNLHGFDYYAVTKSQGSYFNPSLATSSGSKLRIEGYVSDAYTDHSIEWLTKRDKTKPFMLMTHYKAVHGPWEYAPRHAEMYKNIDIPEPATLFDDYQGRAPGGAPDAQSRVHKADSIMSLSYWFQTNKKGKPGTWPTGRLDLKDKTEVEKTKLTYQKYIKDYMRAVKGVDEGVGRLLDYLKDEGILENTIVIYTSDQGMYIGEHGLFDKRLGLNPATQMPLLVRYPAAIKAGTVVDGMINNVDFAQTILDMAGSDSPDSMQGYSFWDLARGKTDQAPRQQTLYTFYSSSVAKHYGLVTADYRLLKYIGKDGAVMGVDLFDRHGDPDEVNNLAQNPEYEQVLASMEQRLANEIKSVELSAEKLPGPQFTSMAKANAKPKKKKMKNKGKKKAKSA